MKISINGKVYNTKHFFSISEITEGIKLLSFEIEFKFNMPNSIFVEIPINEGCQDNDSINTRAKEIEYKKQIKETNWNRLEKIRQDIINIWSNNQAVSKFNTRKP